MQEQESVLTSRCAKASLRDLRAGLVFAAITMPPVTASSLCTCIATQACHSNPDAANTTAEKHMTCNQARVGFAVSVVAILWHSLDKRGVLLTCCGRHKLPTLVDGLSKYFSIPHKSFTPPPTLYKKFQHAIGDNLQLSAHVLPYDVCSMRHLLFGNLTSTPQRPAYECTGTLRALCI